MYMIMIIGIFFGAIVTGVWVLFSLIEIGYVVWKWIDDDVKTKERWGRYDRCGHKPWLLNTSFGKKIHLDELCWEAASYWLFSVLILVFGIFCAFVWPVTIIAMACIICIYAARWARRTHKKITKMIKLTDNLT